MSNHSMYMHRHFSVMIITIHFLNYVGLATKRVQYICSGYNQSNYEAMVIAQ